MPAPTTPEEEMALAENLPQADASSLVDRQELEAQVQEMYRQVARGEDSELHFAVGRRRMSVSQDVIPLTGDPRRATLEPITHAELRGFLRGPGGWAPYPESCAK